MPPAPALFALSRHSMSGEDASQSRSITDTRACSFSPRDRTSRPALQAGSPTGALRFPPKKTPKDIVDFEIPNTSDAKLEAEGSPLRQQERSPPSPARQQRQKDRSPHSLPEQELLEQATLWQQHLRQQRTQGQPGHQPFPQTTPDKALNADPTPQGLWITFLESLKTVLVANSATISKEVNMEASARHHADIAAAEQALEQAEAVGAASEAKLTEVNRAAREASLVITAARESLLAGRAENISRLHGHARRREYIGHPS